MILCLQDLPSPLSYGYIHWYYGESRTEEGRAWFKLTRQITSYSIFHAQVPIMLNIVFQTKE